MSDPISDILDDLVYAISTARPGRARPIVLAGVTELVDALMRKARGNELAVLRLAAVRENVAIMYGPGARPGRRMEELLMMTYRDIRIVRGALQLDR